MSSPHDMTAVHAPPHSTRSPHGNSNSMRSPHGSADSVRSPQCTDAHAPPVPYSAGIAHGICTVRPRPPQPVVHQPQRRRHGAGYNSSPTLNPQFRWAPSETEIRRYASEAKLRQEAWETIRLNNINRALQAAGLELPCIQPVEQDGVPTTNKPLQTILSEFVRRTHISLPAFVELLRGQTGKDYRPNKNMIPDVLSKVCRGYQHLPCLLEIAEAGVPVPLRIPLPPQTTRPSNHQSALDRYNVLVKNIRKEQDAWRCIVVDDDILSIWSEVHVSPFGVVDKGDGDPQTTGRVIHGISFPVDRSLNDFTDSEVLCQPKFEHCDAIATEIVHQQHSHPGADIKEQAGDVASAYRHVCIHSNCVHLFSGLLDRDRALVIDMSAAFGWSGSPGNYGTVGGAIAFIHGHTTNALNPAGFFNCHWVDDHINVAADVGSNCADMDRSLRYAMMLVLSPSAINTKKFTSWSTRQKALGLIFDSTTGTVSMPSSKIAKAERMVRNAFQSNALRRSEYRSLLGSLRHVATCIRPARAFLQHLRQHERGLHRWRTVPMTASMREDLLWWLHMLHALPMNGVHLTHFNTLPTPDVVVEMDASDSGACAIIRAERTALTYVFNNLEQDLIRDSKNNPTVRFDINYREHLSCAFAVHAWGTSWAARSRARSSAQPLHVHFRIDNISAVTWQNKMASKNPRTQTVIRLLGFSQHCFERSDSDLAFHLRAHSVSVTTYDQYLKALRKWHHWCGRRCISPILSTSSLNDRVQHITDFILLSFRDGYGSGHGVRSATISATLTGIRHLFTAAGLDFPCGHPQIRMLLKGIRRLDIPVRHKAPVSIHHLELYFTSLNMELPSDQALQRVLCLAFYFLLRRSEIASKEGGSFAWFALKAGDIAVLDSNGNLTTSACAAEEVHIRLTGSKTNQHGDPTLRALNRSGHQFLCPVFGALCLLRSRGSLHQDIPAAVYMTDLSRPACISAACMANAIRHAPARSGEDPNKFSSHSLRAGGATHMYRAGVDSLTIQFHGRWASDTFKQYTRLCKESVVSLASNIVSGSCHVNDLP